jgi:hypothetical protein
MRATNGVILALILGLTACGQSSPTAAQKAKQTADALTGAGAGTAATNPQCRMFTRSEVAAFLGAPAKAGTNAAAGTGCQWASVTGDGSSFVMLQIVRASDHSPPSAAPGFKKLSDVGARGFVVPQLGGWQAGAIQGAKSINVVTSGKTTSEVQTIAFLRQAVTRASAK